MATIITCRQCGAKNRVDLSRASQQQPVCGQCHAPLDISGAGGASDHPITLTDQTFSQTLSDAGEAPVLVDCWAEWCPPCRMLAPTIEQLAAESKGRYVIAKLNTDDNPQVSGQFRISSIPTMLIFKRGQLVDTLVGLQPKQAIAQRLAAHAM